MRIANRSDRLVLISDSRTLDVARASGGRFDADPQGVWSVWPDFRRWSAGVDVDEHPDAEPLDPARLGAPVPRPRQIFAIGLNYADHAAEAGMELPENPLVFTKFPSSLAGPLSTVRLSGDRVDWEAELVLVIGAGGRDIARGEAWEAVAGLTVGQDLSDRTVQSWGAPAQFNLGKSFAEYAPTGAAVVTLDEVRRTADPDALAIRCEIDLEVDGRAGRRVLQDGTTADLIFPVPELIARLSKIVELYPGDLVFTGTPSGVGLWAAATGVPEAG